MLSPLWELFESVELTINHRQGSDHEYGNLLNRVRMGEHTQEDIDLLATRVRTDWPTDALYVYGKKKPTRDITFILPKEFISTHSASSKK